MSLVKGWVDIWIVCSVEGKEWFRYEWIHAWMVVLIDRWIVSIMGGWRSLKWMDRRHVGSAGE